MAGRATSSFARVEVVILLIYGSHLMVLSPVYIPPTSPSQGFRSRAPSSPYIISIACILHRQHGPGIYE